MHCIIIYFIFLQKQLKKTAMKNMTILGQLQGRTFSVRSKLGHIWTIEYITDTYAKVHAIFDDETSLDIQTHFVSAKTIGCNHFAFNFVDSKYDVTYTELKQIPR